MTWTPALLLLALAGAATAQGDCVCASGSTCCRDSPDADAMWECCMDRSTACVAADGYFTSRCCPKWTVGCLVGSVGCCDPAAPYQMPWGTGAARPAGKPAAAPEAGATGVVAYALTQRAGAFKAVLEVRAIDPATGGVVGKQEVTGVAAAYVNGLGGATARRFEFDAAGLRFHAMDVAADTGALQVLTVDAATGASTVADVALGDASVVGDAAYPVGYAYDADAGALVFTLRTADGYAFYKAAVGAGADAGASVTATKVREVARGGSEAASAAFYAGYMTRSYNMTAHRLGLREVVQGAAVGLGRVDVAGTSEAAWRTVDSDLWSLDRAGAGAWISLASGAEGFDVVRWSDADEAGAAATKVANFTGCVPPLGGPQMQGALGYVGTAVAGDVFTAMVIRQTVTKYYTLDNWAVGTYDMRTGATYLNLLQPEFLVSDTVSVAGFGAVKAA